MLKNNPSHRGFTLLEILVVISIIGILIGLVVASFSTAQQKGRDARRRGDIKAMQNAFEQYYSANSSAYSANCSTMATNLPGGLPTDPKTGSTYTCNASTTGYCICALMDSTGGGNANNPGASTTCSYAAGGNYFCMSNLQ